MDRPRTGRFGTAQYIYLHKLHTQILVSHKLKKVDVKGEDCVAIANESKNHLREDAGGLGGKYDNVRNLQEGFLW